MNKIFIEFFIEDITMAIVKKQMEAEDMRTDDMVDISLFGYHVAIAFVTLLCVGALFASVFDMNVFAGMVTAYAVVNTLISYKGVKEFRKRVKEVVTEEY